MPVDLAAAERFMATYARVLDRRRLEVLLGRSDADALGRAVDAYRNPDGGYGWAIEPDLRSPESQPVGALHAFEVFEEVAPDVAPSAAPLCDWLASVSLPDGGLPFALAVTDRAGCAPWWADADHAVSSLHITAAVTATAHRVARHDSSVAEHPWLVTATAYCMDAMSARRPAHALELRYVLDLLDAVHDHDARAGDHLERLRDAIPPEGTLHVEGGTEDEMMRPLDFAPLPGRPVRNLFAASAIEADLDRLEALQQSDGGWPVEWNTWSPAAALEWRGYVTVRAVWILTRNDRLDR